MTEFRRANSKDLGPSELRASWIRLPILWWRDVPLAATEPVELSPLDHFLVDAVTRLGRLTHEQFTLFTGLPARVFGGLARRLWNLGLVGWADDVVTPLEEGHRLITENAVSKTRTIVVDLLYLPHTDDLIVIEDGLGEFERALPRTLSNGAPLPDNLLGLTRDGLLADHIAAGRVVNLPPQVLGPAAESIDEPLHAMAGVDGAPAIPLVPVIECSATVASDRERPRTLLELRLRSQNESVVLDLGPVPGLTTVLHDIDKLLGLMASALEPLSVASLSIDRLKQEAPGRWLLPVTGMETMALAATGSLTAPIAIEIRTDHAHLLTSLEIRAADPAAAGLLAVDAFLDTLLADPANVRSLMAREPQIEETVLRRRAWDLGHYWVAYALRERKDFGYA